MQPNYTQLLPTDQVIVTTTYHSPVGELLIGDYNGAVCMCDWIRSPKHTANLYRLQSRLHAHVFTGKTAVTEMAIVQLDEYFSGIRTRFDLNLHLVGTDFQMSVWHAMQQLAYGATASYTRLAKICGRECATRAVANCVACNPISIIIPCHRIVGKANPTAYAGGASAKQLLLELERGNMLTSGSQTTQTT